jgi:hypothetical protein
VPRDLIVQLLPWIPALALAAVGIIKVSKSHKILLEIRLLMNGKDDHPQADSNGKSELPGQKPDK